MRSEFTITSDTSMLTPIWIPDDVTISHANITSTLNRLCMTDYSELYRWSIEKPGEYWHDVLRTLRIKFNRPMDCVLDMDGGPCHARWLCGAQLNIAESCFNAEPDSIALVYARATGERQVYTCANLLRLANRVANSLHTLDIRPGNAVAICMPMDDLAVGIYLGLILAGCSVVSIADSFSSDQIRLRLQLGGARAAFTTAFIHRNNKNIPLYERMLEAHAPRTVVVGEVDHLRPGDLHWSQFLCANDQFEPVCCEPDSTINVLFSSGTTGEPKAIPWNHTTPIKAAADGYYHHDLHPGDVVAWPTSLGWMMGPWLVFASLINRGTIALFEGTPLDRDFGKFIERERVTMLGLVPSLVRRWKQTRCMEGLDWSAIRAFSSTGECSNPHEMRYLSALAGGRPIIEYCGGTEIGGGYITSTVVQPNLPSAFSTPALGSAFVILDEQNKQTEEGEVFIVSPAMGLSDQLLNQNHDAVYYNGAPIGPRGEVLRRHGDHMRCLGDGYYRSMGRADDTMNLGGIKVSSAEIERTLICVEGVHEVAAVGVPPRDGGPDRLIVFVVLQTDAKPEPQALCHLLQEQIKLKLNPLFKIEQVRIRSALPRTSSNKVIRRLLRQECLADDQ